MEIQTAPDGWRFSTADFSLQAAGKSETGSVMLIRDPEAKARWHQQSEEAKERDDGPPLYVSGEGATFATAMTDASRKAYEAAPIETPNMQVEGAEGCLQPQAPSPTPGSASPSREG